MGVNSLYYYILHHTMFCKLVLLLTLGLALQETKAACPLSDNYDYKVPLSGTAERRKLACDTLNTAMKTANATGVFKSADFDDCMKEFEDANTFKCGCGTIKLSMAIMVLALTL